MQLKTLNRKPMSENPKSKMDFVSFSRYLLQSGDIDPDYMFIREFCAKQRWGAAMMVKWILLKVVVYDSVSELEHLIYNVPLSKLRFGAERRKSKNNATKYLSNIREYFGGNVLKRVDYLLDSSEPLKEIQTVEGFGPWAAWKLMDLVHCCIGGGALDPNTDFRKAYEFPLKGLLMVNGIDENSELLQDSKVYRLCMKNVWGMLKPVMKVKTPHNYFQGVRLNELETLLCKYHSYMHGHYHPGEDIMRLKKNIQASKYPRINKFKTPW